MPATIVTTLPPGTSAAAALSFARSARAAGADAIELRSDLNTPAEVDADGLGAILPLLATERGPRLSADWVRAARWIDIPLDGNWRERGTSSSLIVSLHAPRPLTPPEAVDHWIRAQVPQSAAIKHVEPLGSLAEAGRMFETQKLLQGAFPGRSITVLATGAVALPFRNLLATRNAFDYAAFGGWAAAAGQRLLEDAVRERAHKNGPSRRGILGSRIAYSRSPRVHPQPFDRIDLPPDTKLGPLLAALLPHHAGLAVTSPFKKVAAQAVGASEPAVNTLVRERSADGMRWVGFNTDVAGALAALDRLDAHEVTVLGDGGATSAIRSAAARQGRGLTVLRHASEGPEPVSGAALWTWPSHIPPPETLAFRDCRVGIIAYGMPARRIAALVRERGGTPIRLGAAWFVAQARDQRRLWGDG